MTTLKDLRSRKKSVLATRKITSAMKMIAAAKLKRAVEAVEMARPYAGLMAEMLTDLLSQSEGLKDAQPLLYGNGNNQIHLYVIATSDRGLCGGFNSSVVRHAKRLMDRDKATGKTVKIICWGHKGREQLRREFNTDILDTIYAITTPHFNDAARLSRRLHDLFKANAFDQCTIVYNRFISALSQEVIHHRLIPFSVLSQGNAVRQGDVEKDYKGASSLYEYEPSKDWVLSELLPKNLSVQLFRAMLESIASEQGARMTAMDSATRNAEDMTKALDLQYNRTRQALITKELIEIISGADAL